MRQKLYLWRISNIRPFRRLKKKEYIHYLSHSIKLTLKNIYHLERSVAFFAFSTYFERKKKLIAAIAIMCVQWYVEGLKAQSLVYPIRRIG